MNLSIKMRSKYEFKFILALSAILNYNNKIINKTSNCLY